MAISDYKITAEDIAKYGCVSLPDTLTGNAQENKAKFDRLVRECVANAVNAVIDHMVLVENEAQDWASAEALRVQAEAARVAAENLRVQAENDRADAETARAAAETARALAENLRAEAETARANAENKRDTAEKSRTSAETGRVNAESARVTAESQRANAESVRAQNEATRISAETGRADAEADRVSAEDTRIANENARKSAETDRASAEAVRESGENARKSAEKARASAEQQRESTESTRQTAEQSRAGAETARANAEKARADAETARVSAEQARATAESKRAAAETARQNAETGRTDAETKRVSAETARATAEGKRADAETARATAETKRVSAETARTNAESTRQTNETARVSAEKSRVAAETARQTTEKARNVWEEYSAGKAYVPGNKVSFNGSSYVCTAASTGHAPTDTTYWLLIAKKGEDGKGAGDMLASVYDPKGKAQDVFQYADTKASAAQSAAATYTDNKINAIPTPDVSGQIDTHNTDADAHADKFAKYLPLSGGEMTGPINHTAGSQTWVVKVNDFTGTNGIRCERGLYNYQSSPALVSKQSDNANITLVAVLPDEVLIGAQTGNDANRMVLTAQGLSVQKVLPPTTDTMPTPKSYVDNAVGNLTPSACKVTLTASGWDSTAKTQSATVSGVLEDESKQLIMPMPAGTSMSAYNEAGIQMTAQAANTVTFTADTVPKVDVEVWVVVQAVNDVTPPPPPALDEATWDYISQQSLAGNAKNIWTVGDCKKIKLSGTASKLSLNTELYVYILDFDHDASAVGGTKDGITFGTFKTALTGGKDVCLMSGYDDDSDFRMNTTGTNAGGWKNSDMRYNILGSTNTQNGNATATTAISPKANTLMSCFPADLRAVMRPMCIYTDNTGGGSDTASYVTATIDFLPFLAEFEIHGARTSANSAEQNNQSQYAYFKNGNTKVKYRFNSQSSTFYWWSRSLSSNGSRGFCFVNASGYANNTNANYSNGAAPMFKV